MWVHIPDRHNKAHIKTCAIPVAIKLLYKIIVP